MTERINLKTTEAHLRQSRRLRYVDRWAVIPTVKKQNVAEHSFHVIAIARWLTRYHAQQFESSFVLGVMYEALVHDEEESITGDMPTTSKPRKDYSTWSQEKIVVKVADIIEQLAYIRDEEAMGNKTLIEVRHYLCRQLNAVWQFFQLHADCVKRDGDWYVSQYLGYTRPEYHPSLVDQ